jgi:hypothetical protein
MNNPETALLLSRLAERGWATSAELQGLLGKSQPTLARLLGALAPRLLTLGAGRRTRYALPQTIAGRSAVQPLHWVHEDGRIEAWGTLSFVAGQRVHLSAPGIDAQTVGALPWWLAPLRGEGFIGRLLAARLAPQGLDRDPARWPLEHQLLAALHMSDAPGALVLGEPTANEAAPLPDRDSHDNMADGVATTLHAGSSAGGEQAKFLAQCAEDGAALLVKFTPPRGTPFGERWHDLLHAEALALDTLAEHGVPVAGTRIVETARRTYLESLRFDRVGRAGRRHAVPLWAAHDAFVPGPRQHWAATCDALAAQRRLSTDAAAQARALLHFGRLIGNSDMHFGNLSLFVAPADAARGRFTLAPVYDMLPMRWRPDVATGAFDWLPFTPEPIDLQSAARPVAQAFWQRVAAHSPVSADFRALAREMSARTAG